MALPQKIKNILNFYESDSPGTKMNIARFLMHGKLAGSGRLAILAVDQGFEHGPVKSFAMNPEAYDPHYHFQLAIDAGLSGYAAPLGWLEAGATSFVGEIPTILKMNSSNSLLSKSLTPDQAITASIQDALRLGCAGIGLTIYPGSDQSLEMFEEVRDLVLEAKTYGLAVIIWSYPRGNFLKEGETAIDTIAYGAHIAALLGAHIIKVKLPTSIVESPENKIYYDKFSIKINTLVDRIRHIKECCFKGKRLVIFSGGETKEDSQLIDEVKAINEAKGDGSIIGRNCFQRPHNEAMELLDHIISCYSYGTVSS